MAAKRKHQSVDELVLAKRPNNHDSYCWLCHQSGTKVNCSTCIRSYHAECIGLNYRCDACDKLALANSNSVAKYVKLEYLNQLLKFTIKRLLEDGEVTVY